MLKPTSTPCETSGFKDGKIANITEAAIDGAETIDATGHMVTAGFIDYYTKAKFKRLYE